MFIFLLQHRRLFRVFRWLWLNAWFPGWTWVLHSFNQAQGRKDNGSIYLILLRTWTGIDSFYGWRFSHWNILSWKGRLGNVVSSWTTMCSPKIKEFYKRREMGVMEQLALSATRRSWTSGFSKYFIIWY